METYTGLEVNPLDLRPEDIRIEDIAHSLSLLCRYGGHCKTFYSVAQHSMLVSARLRDPPMNLYGLLHDAAETYLGDMVTPLKKMLPKFEDYEFMALREILRKFCPRLPRPVEMADVKRVDTGILLSEAAFLMSTGGRAWSQHQGNDSIAIPIETWSAEVAEYRFLQLFKHLTIGR